MITSGSVYVMILQPQIFRQAPCMAGT